MAESTDPEIFASNVPIAFRETERARRRSEAFGPLAFYAMVLLGVASGALRLPALMPLCLAAFITGHAALWHSRRDDPISPPVSKYDAPGPLAEIALAGDQLVVKIEDTTRRYRRADIAAGWRDADGRFVLRTSSGADIVMSLPNEEGRRLLRLLHVGVGDRAATLPIASASVAATKTLSRLFGPQAEIGPTIFGVFLPFVMGMLGLGAGVAAFEWQHQGKVASGIMSPIIAALVLSAFYVLSRVRRRRSVTIGSDGVTLHLAFKERFVPWASVETIAEGSDGAAELHLNDGSTVRLDPVGGGEAVLPRIREAMGARGAHETGAVAAALDRGSKSSDAWREHLDRLVTQSDGYRDARLEPDQLVAIVGDAESPPDRRVGAAVVLSKMGDEARSRVRIAVEACAEPEMKEALERAAEGEIAEDEVVLRRRLET